MSTTQTKPVYPVHVDAELDRDLSRGLWLVKWLLALPHYVVLAFLWLAFAVTSVLAFFSILLTGHYPRVLFDFNVGVMRWTWRVAFYAYGALGTDRYPPFSLSDVADYPAHLEVDYPEKLSRGLVLVKWWLLAIPHYIIVGLLLGGVGYGFRGAANDPTVSFSLIGILVLVAGVTLLFTGRYPQRLFDFILGLNRWVLRVAGYVALMTDRYPPFSLDQGPHDPSPAAASAWGSGSLTATSAPTSADSADVARGGVPEPGSTPGWTTGRVVSLVIGSVLVLTSLAFGGGGAALIAVDQGERDADGFLMSPWQPLTSETSAITSGDLQIHVDTPTGALPDGILGDVRLRAQTADGTPMFVGIAPTGDVDAYLSGVARDRLREISNGTASYEAIAGETTAAAPLEQDFWVAQASGDDAVATWRPVNGDWTVVVMNADGSPGINAQVAAGAEAPALAIAIGVLLVLAALTLLAGILMIAIPIRGASATRDS